MVRAAWVTYLTGSDTSYLVGILVLDHSLKQVGSIYPLVVGLDRRQPKAVKLALERCGIKTFECDTLAPDVAASCGVALRFLDCFTKLRAWELEDEYDRVVLIDSDILVRRNSDELMTIDLPRDGDGLAAAHSCVCNKARDKWAPEDWREWFCPYTEHDQVPVVEESSPRTHKLLNSGVVALKPSRRSFDALIHHLKTAPDVGTWICPDQDLMASYYGAAGRRVLPLSFNAIKTARHWHAPHWSDEGNHIIHYIVDKPWQSRTARDPDDAVTHSWWWNSYDQLHAQATEAQHGALRLAAQTMRPEDVPA